MPSLYPVNYFQSYDSYRSDIHPPLHTLIFIHAAISNPGPILPSLSILCLSLHIESHTPIQFHIDMLSMAISDWKSRKAAVPIWRPNLAIISTPKRLHCPSIHPVAAAKIKAGSSLWKSISFWAYKCQSIPMWCPSLSLYASSSFVEPGYNLYAVRWPVLI